LNAPALKELVKVMLVGMAPFASPPAMKYHEFALVEALGTVIVAVPLVATVLSDLTIRGGYA
jgi:hypothetical protein